MHLKTLPTMETFQSSIPMTSTPKRSKHFPPLSSTLAVSICSKVEHNELSLSAIPSDPFSIIQPCRKRRHGRKLHQQTSSTMKFRIDLKCLLYSQRTTKRRRKVYLV